MKPPNHDWEPDDFDPAQHDFEADEAAEEFEQAEAEVIAIPWRVHFRYRALGHQRRRERLRVTVHEHDQHAAVAAAWEHVAPAMAQLILDDTKPVLIQIAEIPADVEEYSVEFKKWERETFLGK